MRYPPRPMADLCSEDVVVPGSDMRKMRSAAAEQSVRGDAAELSDIHSLPATTHLWPSSLFAMAPPPFDATRGIRTWRGGPWGPWKRELEKGSRGGVDVGTVLVCREGLRDIGPVLEMGMLGTLHGQLYTLGLAQSGRG